MKRGRDADAYYRLHREIDTVIGHSLGSGCSFFRKASTTKGDNPSGIVQSKTCGALTVPGNLGSRFGGFGKSIRSQEFNIRFGCCWWDIHRRICGFYCWTF